jgi:hypothetical protein
LEVISKVLHIVEWKRGIQLLEALQTAISIERHSCCIFLVQPLVVGRLRQKELKVLVSPWMMSGFSALISSSSSRTD